ncbi:hypothetical protein SAMN05216413_2617 [Ruminococcaceae bacterium KH2T8]|nr:hypothetical protein SAMN05216413_2617 [Ruminococcaceae bacterium KH2T8]
MAKVRLDIDAEQAKIDALRVYLERKNTCLEIEIERHIESLYTKNVPNIVRDYIAAISDIRSNERRSEA